MEYDFLIDTYGTERLKTLSVWSMFEDGDLLVRSYPLDNKDRNPLEHMVHQCMSEDKWFCSMFGIDVGAPPLPGQETRLEFIKRYADDSGLPLQPEPCLLHFAGRDRFGRPLWLRRGAAQGWRRMRLQAAREGIALDAISGFRSHAYQLGIFERKLARGLSVTEILKVNAAPGFSEHHSGHALDIGTPGDAPAEESFEATDAFAWLQVHAGGHGFHLSYPRDNPHGIVYEPWHWCWRPANG